MEFTSFNSTSVETALKKQTVFGLLLKVRKIRNNNLDKDIVGATVSLVVVLFSAD